MTVAEDIRSKRIVLIPFCLICQGFQARGIARDYPAIVKPVLMELVKQEINIIQMPCPESHFGGYARGLKREPKGIDDYDVPEFRKLCGELADDVSRMIRAAISEDFEIIAILGMEYSPSCAVNFQADRSRRPGIFIEILREKLKEEDITIPFIGVDKRHTELAIEDLKQLIEHPSMI